MLHLPLLLKEVTYLTTRTTVFTIFLLPPIALIFLALLQTLTDIALTGGDPHPTPIPTHNTDLLLKCHYDHECTPVLYAPATVATQSILSSIPLPDEAFIPLSTATDPTTRDPNFCPFYPPSPLPPSCPATLDPNTLSFLSPPDLSPCPIYLPCDLIADYIAIRAALKASTTPILTAVLFPWAYIPPETLQTLEPIFPNLQHLLNATDANNPHPTGFIAFHNRTHADILEALETTAPADPILSPLTFKLTSSFDSSSSHIDPHLALLSLIAHLDATHLPPFTTITPTLRPYPTSPPRFDPGGIPTSLAAAALSLPTLLLLYLTHAQLNHETHTHTGDKSIRTILQTSGLSPFHYHFPKFLTTSLAFLLQSLALVLIAPLFPIPALTTPPRPLLILLFAALPLSLYPLTVVVTLCSKDRQTANTRALMLTATSVILQLLSSPLFGTLIYFLSGSIQAPAASPPLYDLARYLLLLFPPFNFTVILTILSERTAGVYDVREDVTKAHASYTYTDAGTPFTAQVLFATIEHNSLYAFLGWLAFDFFLWWAVVAVVETYRQYGLRSLSNNPPRATSIQRAADDEYRIKWRERLSRLAPSARPLLELKNVTLSFSTLKALQNVTMSVPKSKTLALLGNNGAGKSSLISVITKTITHGGTCVAHDVNSIGYVPQFDEIFELLTGLQYVQIFASLRRAAEGSALRALSLVGLDSKLNSLYSGGERRRLSIAAALVGNPDLIILDEPTAGVDLSSRTKIWELISGLDSTVRAREQSKASCMRRPNGEVVAKQS